MSVFFIFVIAISLSMDAFSLSLAYGTLSFSKKEIKTLALIVGIYHFFMPIIGMTIGAFVIKHLHIKGDLIVFVVFMIIGVGMVFDSFKTEKTVKKLKLMEMFFFGLAVSIDSFSVGIGIKNISDNFLLCSIIFSVVSFIFTYLGMLFGAKITKIIGTISTLVGGITLISLSFTYLL